MKRDFTVFVTYEDGSESRFVVTSEENETEVSALLMMITRGVLMASTAKKAVCYDDKGFDVCSYVK